MKKATITIALALSLGSTVALAENATVTNFINTTSVTQLTDQDLATVQGSWGWGWGRGRGDSCHFCSNTAHVSQFNVSLGSIGVLQANGSAINQSNN